MTGAEQIGAMPQETGQRWTAAEVREMQVLAWPRFELIDGRLHVTPGPAMAHERALMWLHRALDTYLQQNPGVGELFGSPSDVAFEDEQVLQPDRFVVPAGEAARALKWADVRHLLLAVEVLSPSTAHTDRGIKREVYQRNRVDEYWIVDLDARLVERWRPGDDRPEIVRDELVWSPPGSGATLIIDLQQLFKAARVTEGP